MCWGSFREMMCWVWVVVFILWFLWLVGYLFIFVGIFVFLFIVLWWVFFIVVCFLLVGLFVMYWCVWLYGFVWRRWWWYIVRLEMLLFIRRRCWLEGVFSVDLVVLLWVLVILLLWYLFVLLLVWVLVSWIVGFGDVLGILLYYVGVWLLLLVCCFSLGVRVWCCFGMLVR